MKTKTNQTYHFSKKCKISFNNQLQNVRIHNKPNGKHKVSRETTAGTNLVIYMTNSIVKVTKIIYLAGRYHCQKIIKA